MGEIQLDSAAADGASPTAADDQIDLLRIHGFEAQAEVAPFLAQSGEFIGFNHGVGTPLQSPDLHAMAADRNIPRSPLHRQPHARHRQQARPPKRSALCYRPSLLINVSFNVRSPRERLRSDGLRHRASA